MFHYLKCFQSEQNLVSQQMGDYLPNYEYNMPVTVQPVYQEQQVNNNQQQHLNANVVDSSQSYTIAKVVPYEQWWKVSPRSVLKSNYIEYLFGWKSFLLRFQF